jgi:hypothetical protein
MAGDQQHGNESEGKGDRQKGAGPAAEAEPLAPSPTHARTGTPRIADGASQCLGAVAHGGSSFEDNLNRSTLSRQFHSFST